MRTKLAAIVNLLEESERLQPLTSDRPVASLPFGCRYRLIDFPFSSLHNAEVISAAVFIPGSGHSLYDHVRSGSVWGLDSPVGGGVFTHSQINWKWKIAQREDVDFTYYDNHRKYVERAKSAYVFITGSNMLSNVNLDTVLQYHNEKGNVLTALFKNVSRESLPEKTNTFQYVIDGEQAETIKEVKNVQDGSTDSGKTAVGMNKVVMNTNFFMDFLNYAEENMKEVSALNAIRYALDRQEPVSAFEYTGYLKSVEDIQSYYEANMDMLEERNFASLFYRNDPVVTRTRHGAPTYYGKEAAVEHSQMASDCEIYGTVKKSLIFRKTFVSEGAEVSDSILMHGTHIGKNAVLKHVILDKNVRVEEGVRLEGTKENPLVIKKESVITQENQ